MPDPDTHDVVEPRVLCRRRLKKSRHAEIIAVSFDGLALLKPRYDIRWPLSHTPIIHTDHGIVSRLQHQPNIQGGAAIAPDTLPVTRPLQYLARHPLSFEHAPRHDTDPAKPTQCRAANLKRQHLQTHDKEWFDVHVPEHIRQTVK